KIYTKTGDDGTTGLFGGRPPPKASARVAAYGTVDELNAVLGAARASKLGAEIAGVPGPVQEDLFVRRAELAGGRARGSKRGMSPRPPTDAERLERAIHTSEAHLTGLKNFVVPGGSAEAAHLHLACTVCRRAEPPVLGMGEPAARRDVVIY